MAPWDCMLAPNHYRGPVRSSGRWKWWASAPTSPQMPRLPPAGPSGGGLRGGVDCADGRGGGGRDVGGRLTCWVLLLVIPGLGMAQEPTGLPPAGYRGWTFCRPSGEVESWYRDDAVTAQLLPRVSTLRGEVEAIRAHERVHWEQYHRYATCGDADQARVGSADTALAFEAGASCA